MSLISLASASFNTIATCATTVCVIEYGFRKWAIQYFSDDSKYGRAILHGLDISHYFLGAASIFSPGHKEPIGTLDIVLGVLFLPIPIISKAICKMTDPTQKIYRRADCNVQGMRINCKIAGLLASISAFVQAEPRAAKLTSGIQCVVLSMAFLNDTITTYQYHNQSIVTNFYRFLKLRVPVR